MVDVTYEDYQDLVRKLSLANERVRDLQERVSGRDARIAALEAQLAEALKALEPFASVALLDQTPDAPRGMWVSVPFGWLQDARRAREGGK